MKIDHEETKSAKKDQKKPSCSSFLRGGFSAGAKYETAEAAETFSAASAPIEPGK
jgi:hypothetical protein